MVQRYSHIRTEEKISRGKASGGASEGMGGTSHPRARALMRCDRRADGSFGCLLDLPYQIPGENGANGKLFAS